MNKERELAAREADAARLREQEFFDKRKAEETDFDKKARREKEAERYTEKDTDRSKSFEDRKDEAKIDKDYSTNADKQVDSSLEAMWWIMPVMPESVDISNQSRSITCTVELMMPVM